MASSIDIWNKYQRWCRLLILIHEGGNCVCKDILSLIGITDTTDGAEIYSIMKPFKKNIQNLGIYHQNILLPDNEVIDKSKIDFSLTTHIIQILDKLQNYPLISELRKTRIELILMPQHKRCLTEQQFNDYWDNISHLLTSLNYDMNLTNSLKTFKEIDLSEEHEKILQDVTRKFKGSIKSNFLIFYVFGSTESPPNLSVQNNCFVNV